MKKEHETLSNYLKQRGLKHTSQRTIILDTFLATKKHISADELHNLIRSKNPGIGFSTVYRTLRLLTECGLAREVNFGDGRARFERGFERGQHGHLICTVCGSAEEFTILSVERSIKKISSEFGFTPEGHRIEVYGRCKKCS